MAINQKGLMNLFGLGALLALFAGLTLRLISQFVSLIPGITVDLQAITITSTGLTGVVGTGLAGYAQRLFGLIPFVTPADWIITAVAGGAFVVIGGLVVDAFKDFGIRDKVKKLAAIFVAASIVTGIILTMQFEIPDLSILATMIIDALIFAWIVGLVPALKKMIP